MKFAQPLFTFWIWIRRCTVSLDWRCSGSVESRAFFEREIECIEWWDYISRRAWEHLGVPTDELKEVTCTREVWGLTVAPVTNSRRRRRREGGRRKGPTVPPGHSPVIISFYSMYSTWSTAGVFRCFINEVELR